MEILNLGSNGEESPTPVKKKNKTLTTVVGISGIAAVTGLGSTLAANISLNNDQAVEFGQGVTQTVACDSDGFTINPVTRYDNAHSKFRIDYVEITGINLTPKGTNYSDGGYNTIQEALAAHPGQYYNGSTWVNTCDGVVLDFKAYTDSTDFQDYTVNDTTSSPLYWAQYDGGTSDLRNSSFAVWINSTDNHSNYGADGNFNTFNDQLNRTLSIHIDGANSKFKIQEESSYDMFAGAVNKFTVESMPEFPSSYQTAFQYDNSYYWNTY